MRTVATSMSTNVPDEILLPLVRETATRLTERQPQIARELSERLTQEIDRLDVDSQMVELLNASVDANSKAFLYVLANSIPADRLTPITAAVEYALRLAQRGVPAYSLVRAYHMGQSDFTQYVFEVVQQLNCDPDLRIHVLRHIANIQSIFSNANQRFVLEAYEREAQRWSSRRGSLQAALINRILSNQPVDIATLEAGTGYLFDQFHVATAAWTRNEPNTGDLRSLEHFVRELASECGCIGQPLITAADHQTIWAWLPFGRRAPQPDMDSIRGFAARSGPYEVTFGLPGAGLSGFSRSHQQAQAAKAVMIVAQDFPNAVGFGDPGVGIMSLLVGDIAATHRWLHDVLGPLASNDQSNASLRKTLRVFFGTGENYAKTAEQLGLHRNTIKYRVNKALEDLGAMGRNRQDIAIALMVYDVLGSAS